MVDREKRDRFREGWAVDMGNGVSGKINKEKKTIDFSNGWSVPMSEQDEKEFMPATPAARRAIIRQEQIEGEVESTPFGETLYKMGEHSTVLQAAKKAAENFIQKPMESLRTLEGQENMGFLERLGENKAAELRAQSQVSERISKENPYQTAAGAVLGTGIDLASVRNMSGARGAGTLSLAGNADRILEDPKGVIEDVALSTGLGYGADKVFQGLTNIAGKRGAYPGAKENISNIEAQNIAGKESRDILNKQGKYQSEQARQNTINRNQIDEILTDQRNAAGKSAIDQANQNARQSYASQRAHNDQIMQQYEAANAASQHAHRAQGDLLSQMQRNAQTQYSANTMQAVDDIAKRIGKDIKFSAGQLGHNEFISDFIGISHRAGTKTGNEAGSFLRSLFSKAEKGNFTSKDLVRSYQAIENKIASGTPEMKQVLSEFKEFLGQRLIPAIDDSRFYNRYFPKFQKEFSKRLDIASNALQRSGKVGLLELRNSKGAILDSLKNLSPQEFSQLSRNGSLKQYIRDTIGQRGLEKVPKGKKGINRPEIDSLLADEIDKSADKLFRQTQQDAFIAHLDTQNLISKSKIQRTQGFAPEMQMPPPQHPQRPNITQPQPPVMQQFTPQQPNVMPMPPKFVEQPFIPQQVPTIGPAQGFGENMARGIEDFKFGDMMKSKSLTDNPIAKLAGLKYLLGGAALPVEAGIGAGVGAAKLLTSPTATGELSRQGLKQGMLGLVDNMAQRYPSYRNGILDDPRERRSLVKEIEENPGMPLEDKAIYQSKINRGESLGDMQK